ncbi:MAG TPA: Usg family protein [Magnetospirillaceae bacterium]
MSDLALQLNDYRLTTAEILYRLPDHPALLQTYVWQQLDLLPDFPVLKRFLAFWERNLDGPLHSVRVCSARVITPGEARFAREIGRLH